MKIGQRAGRLFALFTLATGPIACYVLKEEVLKSVHALVEEEQSEFFFSTTLTETNYVYRAQRTEKRPGGTYNRPTTDNKSYT